MRASEKMYEEVAERCSAYSPSQHCSCSNSASDKKVSCSTCKHFTKEEYCDIDLYDEIVASHNLES